MRSRRAGVAVADGLAAVAGVAAASDPGDPPGPAHDVATTANPMTRGTVPRRCGTGRTASDPEAHRGVPAGYHRPPRDRGADLGRHRPVRAGAVAQLTVFVEPPAPEGVRGAHPTGV